ncbi:SMT3 [Coccidioides posadasii str. Silveira]|uniref:SMT3 n=1 Tax=Coccidioides posadasii (strain RMSCC 757 / Silveira) TaxID=443226 RepID=E9DID0_COCPS|nr:SMT3 [Coccidioides posadasii str. Silveira]
MDPQVDEAPQHLNIKVTDNNNEVFFKIKRTTQLKKLMDAFCERQGRQLTTVRFLFDGTRVRPEDSPDTKCTKSRLVADGPEHFYDNEVPLFYFPLHSKKPTFCTNTLDDKFLWSNLACF